MREGNKIRWKYFIKRVSSKRDILIYLGGRFLRFQKEYKPPVDARERMLQLSKDVIPRLTKLETEKAVLKYKITDAKTKFDLLSRAFVQFDHGVPNSMLYMMDSVGESCCCAPIFKH